MCTMSLFSSAMPVRVSRLWIPRDLDCLHHPLQLLLLLHEALYLLVAFHFNCVQKLVYVIFLNFRGGFIAQWLLLLLSILLDNCVTLEKKKYSFLLLSPMFCCSWCKVLLTTQWKVFCFIRYAQCTLMSVAFHIIITATSSNC